VYTVVHINSRHQVVPGGTGKKWVPVQMILCVKEKNAKKINRWVHVTTGMEHAALTHLPLMFSHRWFFK
jgi:hypothetical protein